MRYLLGTNIVSELNLIPQGRGTEWVWAVGEMQVATRIRVATELRYRAAKKGSARLTAQVEATVGVLGILPFGEAPEPRDGAAHSAGAQRAREMP